MTAKNFILQLILLSAFIVLPLRSAAQQFEVSLRAFPSSWYNSYFEPGIDGAGIGLTYHPILNKVLRLNITGEFAVLRARNEVLFGFGINKTIIQGEHFRISIEANLLNGVDLYKPVPLYVGGIEAGPRFDYYLKKRVSLFAGIGARATFCPGYRSIGVWKHSSWPLAVGIRF